MEEIKIKLSEFLLKKRFGTYINQSSLSQERRLKLSIL